MDECYFTVERCNEILRIAKDNPGSQEWHDFGEACREIIRLNDVINLAPKCDHDWVAYPEYGSVCCSKCNMTARLRQCPECE